MPPRRAVELRVGGQTYRVVASDDDPHVQHLAELVDRKFVEVVPSGVGRSMTAHQAMFLTAMALAAEVEEQRRRAERLEGERDRSLRLAARAREVVGRLLQRVDSALSAPRPSARPDSAPGRADTGSSGDARPTLPSDIRQPLPDDVRQSHPRMTSVLDALTEPPSVIHEPLLIDLIDSPSEAPPERPDLRPGLRPAPPPAQRPVVASSVPFEQDNDATVPRTPRAGLRLVRRSPSSDDDTR